jgi:integrase/recombinase XerD
VNRSPRVQTKSLQTGGAVEAAGIEPAKGSPRSAAVVHLAAFDRERLDAALHAEAARVAREQLETPASPLGLLVERYLRWFGNEWGATPASQSNARRTLAKMVAHLGELDPAAVTVEHLRDAIDATWGHTSAATRQRVTSTIRGFWRWVEDEEYLPASPAARLRRPRAPKRVTPLLPVGIDTRLLAGARTDRDVLALLILLDCGVRRSELRGIRVVDLDVGRRQLTVFGKGQKERTIPLRGRVLAAVHAYLDADLEGLARHPEPRDFLLYPIKRAPDGTVIWADPRRSMSDTSVHRWWYQQLERANVVRKGTRGGMHMHRARHTFATELRRVAGLEAASQALGHADLSTTLNVYGHMDETDLERAMDAFAETKREAE